MREPFENDRDVVLADLEAQLVKLTEELDEVTRQRDVAVADHARVVMERAEANRRLADVIREHDRLAELAQLRGEEVAKWADAAGFARGSLSKAHRKIGEVRKLVETFWSRANAHDPRDHENAWAMHVALVQLAEVLRRGADDIDRAEVPKS